jgi:hypothetical protein
MKSASLKLRTERPPNHPLRKLFQTANFQPLGNAAPGVRRQSERPKIFFETTEFRQAFKPEESIDLCKMTPNAALPET